MTDGEKLTAANDVLDVIKRTDSPVEALDILCNVVGAILCRMPKPQTAYDMARNIEAGLTEYIDENYEGQI